VPRQRRISRTMDHDPPFGLLRPHSHGKKAAIISFASCQPDVPISGELTAASLLTAGDAWTSADNGTAAPLFHRCCIRVPQLLPPRLTIRKNDPMEVDHALPKIDPCHGSRRRPHADRQRCRGG
jgi:hypothetical protein